MDDSSSKQLRIRRINVGSAVKVVALVYGLVGLIVGAFVTLFVLLAGNDTNGAASVFFGVFAIVLLPLMYAVAGALSVLIWVVLYNVVAKRIGGIKIYTDSGAPKK